MKEVIDEEHARKVEEFLNEQEKRRIEEMTEEEFLKEFGAVIADGSD